MTKTSTVVLIILTLFFQSCSSAWHLKQAIKKGAQVKIDTIYVNVPVPASTTHDTLYVEKKVFMDKIFRDTLIVNSTKWKTKTIYDSITKTVYQQVYIKADTLKQVPVLGQTTITEPLKKWKRYEVVLGGISLILVLAIILVITMKFNAHSQRQ